MSRTKLMLGDNILSLKKLPENSIDSIVTDPPYGLSFMGKKWDYDVPSIEFWKEVYRVLKPGGHILSFGGTRTYHRMVVNMEDAGFEIRDQIMWIYGSGFPKSHNIGKSVDKIQGNEREVVGKVDGCGPSSNNIGGSWEKGSPNFIPLTKGTSPQEGWGTGLKPANEPICLARKPISEDTIALNVLKWGTGGINIDGCRIGSECMSYERKEKDKGIIGFGMSKYESDVVEGRFPANILFDEEAAQTLDEQSGISKSSKSMMSMPNITGGNYKTYKGRKSELTECGYNDKGGASRFFYVAKVSKKERNMGLDGFEFLIHTGTIKHLIYKEKNKVLWQKEDLRINSHQVDMEVSHLKDIEEFGAQVRKERKWNIEWFGNYIMDQCQKDFKSITSMVINSTMIYQTLNSLIQKNIKTFIVDAQLEKMVDIKYVSDVEKKSTSVSIILQSKDGYLVNVKDVELLEVLSLEPSMVEIKSDHPTLKPINLMTYLIRLVTPVNGIVLDPFMGSGSTGIAAQLAGFKFCGMEMDKEYFKISEARINNFELYRELIKNK